MKNILLAAFLLASTALISCSKKDKDDKAFLYGDWTITSARYQSVLNGRVFTDDTALYPAGNRLISFGTDAHFEAKDSNDPSFLWQGTYDLKDKQLVLNMQYGKDTIPVAYDYTLTGTNMTIVNSGTNTIPEGSVTYSNTMELTKK